MKNFIIGIIISLTWISCVGDNIPKTSGNDDQIFRADSIKIKSNIEKYRLLLDQLNAPYKEKELLIKYFDTIDISAISYFENENALNKIKRYHIVNNLYHYSIIGSSTVSTKAFLILENPLIEFVEPNSIGHVSTNIPNDPGFPGLYGMHNTGQNGGMLDADIDAPEAWDHEKGNSSIIVGIIDSGIDYDHPDLLSNIWTNPGEIAGNGIDDDNNGYIDDIHGWDWAYDDNEPTDFCGHGTHVAGTVGAIGNNSEGVAGVCWQVKLMALKFLNDNNSGNVADAISAVEYATDNGATLTNNSWTTPSFSSSLKTAILNSNMIFVAAAGNGGPDNIGDDIDITPLYPASFDCDNIIAVAALDNNNNIATFSNFGATSVDVGAYGDDILSTKPDNATFLVFGSPGQGLSSDFYGIISGTSMASPQVAGLAALLYSDNTSLSWTEAKNTIMNTVVPVPDLNGITVTGGSINAYNALTNCNPCPNYDFIIAPTSSWNTHSSSHSVYDCIMYRLTVVNGHTYTFKTGCGDGATANYDTYLELYNSSCNLIDTDNDGCESNRSIVEWTPSFSGYAYLNVKGFTNAFGSYTLAFKMTDPIISLTPSSNDFGNEYVGQCTPSQTFILENIGGGMATGNVALSGTYSSHFQIISGDGPFSLSSGQSKMIYVSFCPNYSGGKTATLNANGDFPCNDAQSSLSGTGIPGPDIVLSPSSNDFDEVALNDCSSSYQFTLENVGVMTANGNLSLTGTDASQFEIISGGGPFTLSIGQSKVISVRFCPSSTGYKQANLYADGSYPCNDDQSNLSGDGVYGPEITLAPSSHDFGEETSNYCTPSYNFTLTNVGGSVATGIISLTGTDASQFEIVSGGGSFTLNDNQSQSIQVRFCPGTPGTKTCTLLVSGDYPCNSVSSELTGTGLEYGPCSYINSIEGCGSGNSGTYLGGGIGTWFNTSMNACGYPSPGIEGIYSFVAPFTGYYSIQVTSANGYVDYLWKSSYCSSSGWTCIEDVWTTGQYGSLPWTAGTTYYILLDDEDNAAGSHTFYINYPVPFSQLNLNNITIENGQTQCYDALQTITVAGDGTNFIVEEGGTLTLISGNKIEFLTGTQIDTGSHLESYITTTGQYCGSLTSSMMLATEMDLIHIEKEGVLSIYPDLNSTDLNIIHYPNPTTGKFYLEFQGCANNQEIIIEIYAMFGSRVSQEALIGRNMYEYSLEGEPDGVYLIRVITGNDIQTFRLIKQ